MRLFCSRPASPASVLSRSGTACGDGSSERYRHERNLPKLRKPRSRTYLDERKRSYVVDTGTGVQEELLRPPSQQKLHRGLARFGLQGMEPDPRDTGGWIVRRLGRDTLRRVRNGEQWMEPGEGDDYEVRTMNRVQKSFLKTAAFFAAIAALTVFFSWVASLNYAPSPVVCGSAVGTIVFGACWLIVYKFSRGPKS